MSKNSNQVTAKEERRPNADARNLGQAQSSPNDDRRDLNTDLLLRAWASLLQQRRKDWPKTISKNP